MQVRILPAVPQFLPGSVKVARRSVKPFGVGASPTLAANSRKAGRYKLAASVPKTESAKPGGRSVTDAFRQCLTLNRRKSHETDCSLSKPVALSPELQTSSHHANPADR